MERKKKILRMETKTDDQRERDREKGGSEMVRERVKERGGKGGGVEKE